MNCWNLVSKIFQKRENSLDKFYHHDIVYMRKIYLFIQGGSFKDKRAILRAFMTKLSGYSFGKHWPTCLQIIGLRIAVDYALLWRLKAMFAAELPFPSGPYMHRPDRLEARRSDVEMVRRKLGAAVHIWEKRRSKRTLYWFSEYGWDLDEICASSANLGKASINNRKTAFTQWSSFTVATASKDNICSLLGLIHWVATKARFNQKL